MMSSSTKLRPGSRRRSGKRCGFALIDVSIAIAILAVAMGVLLGGLFSAMRLTQVNESTAAANQALRSLLDRLSAMPARDVFAVCNDDASDDLPGVSRADLLGVAPSALRDVHGAALEARVSFPEDAGEPATLLEQRALLPIELTLEWEGPGGRQ
jgi:hypothetical protein